MEYLEPKEINEDLPSSNNPSGTGFIQRFTSKQFGSTFSRVTRIVHETVTAEARDLVDDYGTPVSGAAILMPCERIKNSILLGRVCDFPNKSRTLWTSLQERKVYRPPYDDTVLTFSSEPFIGFVYNGFYLEFPNGGITAGNKYVIQLLFIEL